MSKQALKGARHTATAATAKDGVVYLATQDAIITQMVVRIAAPLKLSVQEFSTLQEFLVINEPERLSLLLLDVTSFGIGRSLFQSEIHRHGWIVPIIEIIDRPDTQEIVSAVKSGAVTVLEKPTRNGLLQDAVMEAVEVCRRARYEMQKAYDFRQLLDRLTSKELEVLDLILEGVPNKIIARKVGVSVRTIETRRSRIYKRLKVGSVVPLVRGCIAAGYIRA